MRKALPAWSASPIVVLLAVPGMVAAIGIFLTILGGQAVRESNLESARERLSEQTTLLANSIERTLEQSDPRGIPRSLRLPCNGRAWSTSACSITERIVVRTAVRALHDRREDHARTRQALSVTCRRTS
jgi:hypothetical protein